MSIAKAIIVDIDGTLANVDHRLHFIRGSEREKSGEKDWHSFHQACTFDKPNDWCLELVHFYKEKDFKVFLITGRDIKYREQTVEWLSKYEVPYDGLHMRPQGARNSDFEEKEKVYRENIEGKYEVRFVLEDRSSVVAMWRKVGLVCLQCAPGDF